MAEMASSQPVIANRSHTAREKRHASLVTGRQISRGKHMFHQNKQPTAVTKVDAGNKMPSPTKKHTSNNFQDRKIYKSNAELGLRDIFKGESNHPYTEITISISCYPLAFLVGGGPTPLKNMKVSWDDSSQYMDK